MTAKAVFSSQKVGNADAFFQICQKMENDMKRKSSTIEVKTAVGDFVKGEIPYYVDNLFYESFGMSCDEVFELLMKRETYIIDIVS